MTTQAVILAAGRGTRLEELTTDKPKVMCEVRGKPILEHTLDKLRAAGVKKAVIVVHYKKEHIIEYFGDSHDGMHIVYVEQKKMQGTADAVLTAQKHITDSLFLCLAGDVMFEQQLLSKVLKHKKPVITVCEVPNPSRYGVIEPDDGRVKRIVEKSLTPPSNLANASIYLFPKTIFEACKKIEKSSRGEYEVTDAIQYLIDDGELFEYEIITKWIDIGVKEHLAQAQELAKKL